MINYIEAQRAKMLTMDHPFIGDAKAENAATNQINDLLTTKTKVSDEITLKSHTFVEPKNN